MANTSAVVCGCLFLMNGESSSWNDESVKRDISEEMKAIIWKRSYLIYYYNYADYMSINSYISGRL